MLYRKLPKGKEEISILGIGTSSIQVSGEKEIKEIVSTAIENGINFFDMASSEAKPFGMWMNLGVIGICLAMVGDWLVKAALIWLRYRSRK